MPPELKLASFHELASVKLAEGLNASLILRPFFEGYTRNIRPNFHRYLGCEKKRSLLEFLKVREIQVRSTKERLELRTSVSLFTLASS